MHTFQAICAKNGQKVELIVKYNTLEEAREGLHKQGYSIIDIREMQQHQSEEATGKVFYFDVLIEGKKKSGQIQSNDIFKAYIKLVDDLHYTVGSIYENVNASEEEKFLTTSKIQASYDLYKQQHTEKTVKQEKKETVSDTATESKEKQAENIAETYVGKELQLYYWLIDRILLKIENILNAYEKYITQEKKAKLQELFITIKQLKNTTNRDKLRLVSEAALLKIGALELELMKENIELEKKDFIIETNQLLKKFGSSQKIQNPESDVLLKLKCLLQEWYEKIPLHKEEKSKTPTIDTQSFVFYKNIRELHIYKQKISEINRDLFFATILFKGEKQKRLRLKKKLVLQNIQLIQKRIRNTHFSYTKIIKGVRYYFDVILYVFRFLWNITLYIVFFFSVSYLLIHGLMAGTTMNYSVLYLILLLSLFSFLSRVVKNFSSLVFSGMVYMLFVVFVRINF